MPNTYTQIYIHIVFAVEGRARLIPKAHKEELHKFISGIISKRGQKLLAIHCMPDHTHILVGLKPTIALSDLVRDIKAGSSSFISAKNWVKGKFQWQTGFGAFSYAHSQLGVVINYINNQEERHKRTSFKEEYVSFLNKFNVDYNEKYLFEWIE
ncbi:IS200/IS605 family transposase [Fulvivirga kasyanovii]|uniref:IS200/IS605 family transposase n=1 Tax=Fulvivirga kasyanovii TaxID=396812 RepID=A0ABW9RXS1_9BACT|nr:IS200/IS605 family transposase [Fulvivirga kasyanovii]MTI29054.1 IS200/IS605 family transposase [Fulvivirga kasyanovii]